MNGPDRQKADTRTAVLSRLQATMPTADSQSPSMSANGAQATAQTLENTKLYKTKFSKPVERSLAPPSGIAKRADTRLTSATDAIRAHRWTITGLALAGCVLGYVYTVKLCVPLYQIQASIELQSSQSGSYADTLSHVLESQSLVRAALAAMPQAEQDTLVEKPVIGQMHDLTVRLRERLTARGMPSADVIDIELISPNRQAGVDFTNSLIRALIQRNEDQKKAAVNDISSNMPQRPVDGISIIDPAIASADPVAPNGFANILLGLLIGAFGSIAFVLLRVFARNTFHGPGSVGQVLGMRELGAIPERKLLAAPGESTASMHMDANDESLRYLRSSLLYHPGRQEVRYIAFTSAAPGEGKTTVVSNLSMSLAATGRRVLVIDGDLRRPRLHKLLQVPQGPGLADLLRRDPSGPPAVLSKYVVSTAFQNLYVLPPGSAGIDAPELLAGTLLAKLVRELGKSFDFVLIDTPPLLACSDARNYARAVEGVVLVVRSAETQKRAALMARDMLLQDGATLIGTVLTGWRQAYPAYNYPSTANYART